MRIPLAGAFPCALALVGAAASPALSQRESRSVECDGRSVSQVAIRTHPPRGTDTASVRGTLAAAERQYHATTREAVVRAYLLLRAGAQCTERDRAESERVLRAQPFLAAATVRTVPDGPDRVRVEVETADEVPVIIGAGVRRGQLSKLAVGSENFAGRGLTLAVTYENGFAYRDGFAVEAVQYGAFGRPYTLAALAAVRPRGDDWSFELAHPLLTQHQYRGYHLGTGGATDYYGVLRPSGDVIALKTRRMTMDFAFVARVNPVGRGAPAGLLGFAVLGEETSTSGAPSFLTDSGFVDASSDPVFAGRYGSRRATRLAVVGGFRALRFLPVRGFDALSATQDVGVGLQVDALGGPSIASSGGGARDVFLSGSVYWGAGHARSFLQGRAVAEGRTSPSTHSWEGVAVGGRMVWYQRPSPTHARTIAAEYAAIRSVDFPLQLTFRDHDGGLRGHSRSLLAGGTRAAARLEERYVFRPFGRVADLAVAGFAEAGQLWPGDVPYGRPSGVRGAVGLGILGAYPAGGKRTYRIDFALPVNRGDGAQFEVRLTSADRTRALWQEPRDLARGRAGAVPANLLSWLPR